MIDLRNLGKGYPTRHGWKWVVRGVNFTAEAGQRWAILGRNGSGKSTLIRLIGGAEDATEGQIRTKGVVSWPLAFGGGFQGGLTGADNIAFVARIYGVDSDELIDYVADFAELGQHYHQPFSSYSSGMRSRLAMGTSMGIHFDTYLVDEVTSVGDADFRAKSQRVFNDRMSSSGAIVVSHSMPMIRSMCDMGAVLDRGVLSVFDDLDEAIAYHEAVLRVPPGTTGD